MPVIGSKFPYYLNCSAHGHPFPTFKWFKDQKEYTQGKIITNYPTSSVIWDHFTTADNGIYACQATNIIKSVLNSQAVFLYCKIR